MSDVNLQPAEYAFTVPEACVIGLRIAINKVGVQGRSLAHPEDLLVAAREAIEIQSHRLGSAIQSAAESYQSLLSTANDAQAMHEQRAGEVATLIRLLREIEAVLPNEGTNPPLGYMTPECIASTAVRLIKGSRDAAGDDNALTDVRNDAAGLAQQLDVVDKIAADRSEIAETLGREIATVRTTLIGGLNAFQSSDPIAELSTGQLASSLVARVSTLRREVADLKQRLGGKARLRTERDEARRERDEARVQLAEATTAAPVADTPRLGDLKWQPMPDNTSGVEDELYELAWVRVGWVSMPVNGTPRWESKGSEGTCRAGRIDLARSLAEKAAREMT